MTLGNESRRFLKDIYLGGMMTKRILSIFVVLLLSVQAYAELSDADKEFILADAEKEMGNEIKKEGGYFLEAKCDFGGNPDELELWCWIYWLESSNSRIVKLKKGCSVYYDQNQGVPKFSWSGRMECDYYGEQEIED